MRALPGPEDRLARAKASPRYGTAVTDALFMTSRDGVRFHRWNEAFLRPGPRRQDAWVYGDNFIFWGMVETASALGDAPHELSLYTPEGYWQGTSLGFRRLTLRLDGFVSLRAAAANGELLTKPLIFEGDTLTLNASTSAAGGIQVEVQDAAGPPSPVTPWPIVRKFSAMTWRMSSGGAAAATCGRCRARPCVCALCSRTATSTPFNSYPRLAPGGASPGAVDVLVLHLHRILKCGDATCGERFT